MRGSRTPRLNRKNLITRLRRVIKTHVITRIMILTVQIIVTPIMVLRMLINTIIMRITRRTRRRRRTIYMIQLPRMKITNIIIHEYTNNHHTAKKKANHNTNMQRENHKTSKNDSHTNNTNNTYNHNKRRNHNREAVPDTMSGDSRARDAALGATVPWPRGRGPAPGKATRQGQDQGPWQRPGEASVTAPPSPPIQSGVPPTRPEDEPPIHRCPECSEALGWAGTSARHMRRCARTRQRRGGPTSPNTWRARATERRWTRSRGGEHERRKSGGRPAPPFGPPSEPPMDLSLGPYLGPGQARSWSTPCLEL